MKFHKVAIFAGISSVTALAGVAQEAPAAPPEAAVQAPEKSVDVLVEELSSEQYSTREAATSELWKLGDAALPALKQAAASKNPEQVYRARDLIRKIQLHITPDTDPSVIALVERYIKGSTTEKTSVLGRLKGKRAWRQMLKLYAAETSQEVREKLRPSLNGIAVRAAAERISQGKPDEAREFLEMAPADSEGLLALAEFHRHQGTLEAELEKTKGVEGPKAALWRLALHRASGNLEAARDAATAAGEPLIAAAMAALAGDPLPWLQKARPDLEDGSVAKIYNSLAVRHWRGEKLRPADLERLCGPLEGRQKTLRTPGMNALFLLGKVDAAEPILVKTNPLLAFSYLESLERIPEALAALGLDPANPDYRTWVEKRVAKLDDDDLDDQHGASSHAEELSLLANFLERRGLHEEAFQAFNEPLAKLATEDVNVFVDFLGNLFGGTSSLIGSPALARRIGIAWAGEDEKRWDEVIVAAFGDDDQFNEWWGRLAEIDPKATRPERLEAMLALFSMGHDPKKLRSKWMDLIWKEAEKAPIAQRDGWVEKISTLAIQVGDVANCLKAWELLPESARAEVFWGQHIMHLSAASRWGEAADTILKQINTMAEVKQDPVAELHAYAASSLRLANRGEEAATHDAWVSKLYLGDAGSAMRIGNGYAFGADYARAADWWARAARQADPESSEFSEALKLHSDGLLEQGNWAQTAAITEVLASIYADSNLVGTNPLVLMRQRLQADMARALAQLGENRAVSIAILERCHSTFASDGSLADFFFPALRKVGLIKEHDKWFKDTWDRMEKTISLYPNSDNTRNTTAWFASRAVRKLDEAEAHLKKALAANPDQPAYLDTMAEIHFARGNRAKALEWSSKAMNFEPSDSQIRRQHERFRSAPIPE